MSDFLQIQTHHLPGVGPLAFFSSVFKNNKRKAVIIGQRVSGQRVSVRVSGSAGQRVSGYGGCLTPGRYAQQQERRRNGEDMTGKH